MKQFVVAVALLCFATAVAQSVPQQPAPAPSSRELLIGSGDLLEVSVYGASDFDKRDVRVNADGNITLPLLGAVRVAGLSISDSEKLIASQLSSRGLFVNPQVTVFAKDYATQGVSVLGEVQKPGVYPMLGKRRLFDAISQAGGLTQKAGKTVAITRRNDPAKPIKVELKSGWESSEVANVDLMPGDTVVIAKAGIVYVVGDVHLPGGFVMENGRMTVLQAVAMAQGANPTAKLNNARLIRNSDGNRTEQAIDLQKILSAKAADLQLQPEDIVFVPSSAAKSAARRGLEAILQTTTGMAIYHR